MLEGSQTLVLPREIPAREVPFRSWNKIRNNGDAISAYLLDNIFGLTPYHGRADRPHLIATGSIFFLANRYSTIWGSGVLNKIAYLPDLQPRQVRALRGRLSADFLAQKNVRLGDVAFGDPGILAADLMGAFASHHHRQYRVGVVPHHDSIDHPFFAQAATRDDVRIIDILDDTLQPIRDIAACDVILSQSLHGLIYAESLGKPSLWISNRSDDIWNFKFDDWFSTTSNPQKTPAPLDKSLDRLAEQCELRGCWIDKKALVASFPAELAQDGSQVKLPFRDCRNLSPLFITCAPPGSPTSPDPTFKAELFADWSKALSGALNALFQGWAERTYCIAVAPASGPVPSLTQARIMAVEMDKRASVDFAFVIRKTDAIAENAPFIAFPGGVVAYRTLKVPSNTVLLRPSFDRLTDNFIVFGV